MLTHDIDVLTQWIRVVLWISAICTTSLPMLYAFYPWRSTRLGRLFMLMAFSFATAIDLTLLFQYWMPKNILVVFWVDAIVFSLIAISTSLMTWKIWYLNHEHRQKMIGEMYDSEEPVVR